MAAAFEVRGVTRRFRAPTLLHPLRSRSVLRGIDLTLEHGQVLGLVGPNGSGKSTLLRLVAGVDLPSEGSIALLGSTPADPGARRRLGYLPERHAVPEDVGPRTALDLILSLRGLPRAERRRVIGPLLKRLELAEHAERRIARLSHGLRRRVGIAAAFAASPDLILLDEPTAGLDAPGHLILHELLDEARARGAAIVLASHHREDLVALDRLAVLVEGRVVQEGSLAALLRSARGVLVECEGATDPDALVALLAGHGIEVRSLAPSDASLLSLYARRDGGSRGTDGS